MSKLRALADEIKKLETEGLVRIDREKGIMSIIRRPGIVTDRILRTGPWGALLLMGKLDEVAEEIFGKRA